MITRMDSSISIITVIYGILNNFSRYLKKINFSRWWSFHYRHSGSSIIPKEGLKWRRLHNGTADKNNTHSEKFPLAIPLLQSRFTPRQRRQKIVLMTHKYRGCIA